MDETKEKIEAKRGFSRMVTKEVNEAIKLRKEQSNLLLQNDLHRRGIVYKSKKIKSLNKQSDPTKSEEKG